MNNLIRLLNEEIEAIEENDQSSQYEQSTLLYLRKVVEKLNKGIDTFTVRERRAVKYAFDDTGEMYAGAGTSVGFDVEDEEDLTNKRSFYLNAYIEASRLGLI